MPRFKTARDVAHSPARMFDLIADVEHYPEFLPLCEDLKVLRRETTATGEILTADMTVGYKALRETFRSSVTLDRNAMRIDVRCQESPFKHLENLWHFADSPTGGCRIGFDLDYRFRSRALQLLMGGMFDKAFSHFAEAFEARADKVYGQPATTD